jgi:hypothetical protein
MAKSGNIFLMLIGGYTMFVELEYKAYTPFVTLIFGKVANGEKTR